MFLARHEKVSHRFTLPLPASEAIELCTPEGERLWIEEWNPAIFIPPMARRSKAWCSQLVKARN